MSSKNNNVKKTHLSDDELLSHSLMYQIVFLLRTIAAQCHMLVPKQLNDIIKRWVGHGLCEVTALPSKLSCPITGKTFLNKDVYKGHYKKNKKKINKIKKKNNGKKPAPPTDLPKFPDVDWTAFLKADNHHKNVIEEVRKCRIESTIWHFSTGALKRIDMDVRPEHCARYAAYSGKDQFDVAGRDLREVICHGTKYDELMALIAWYAIGETSDHNGWCTGLQQKPSVREIRACSIGDTEYKHPVETKPWPVKGKMWGKCHINALRLLLSEGKGSIMVGYHAVRVPCLSFYTILLEPHVVYYDGKTYWDATNTGDEMTSDTGLFIPLVSIAKNGDQLNANNRYRTKHSFVKCQILKSYNEQIPMAREVVRLNTKMEEYDGTTDNSVMMKIAEERDEWNKNLKHETEFFYKAMLEFDDVSEIRYMCRDMCDQAPWLNNPMLLDSTPGMMGIPGLKPISAMNVDIKPSPVHGKGLFSVHGCGKGKVIFQEHSDGGMLISAPAHVNLGELGGVQNNCSYVWGLILGGHAMKGWIANLCLNPRILDHMTAKDHELLNYLVESQTEGRSREQVQSFRDKLTDTFNRLECNQFTVDVPGATAPLNVMSYVGDMCSKLNHSDEPNCRMQSKFEGTKLIYVEAIALRDIMPGEELFIDYGDEYKQMLFTNRDSTTKKTLEQEKEEVKSVPLDEKGIEMARRVAALAGLTPGVDGFEKVGEYCMKLVEDNEFMERAFMQIKSKEDLERLMAAELRKRFREVKVKEEASWDSLAKQFQRTTLGQHVAGDGSMPRFARIATMSGVSPEMVSLTEMMNAIIFEYTDFKNREPNPTGLPISGDAIEAYVASVVRDKFKKEANKNHVSNGRSGDDHKREELEQTSEATGNNQIEFKDIVSKCLDGCNNSYGPLPKIIGMVVEQVRRELTEHETALVNEMLKMRKRLLTVSNEEEKDLVTAMYGKSVKQAEKEVEIRMAKKTGPLKTPSKKRKRYTEPKPRKSGPAKVKLSPKWNVTKPLKQLYDDGSLYAKQVVVTNQKKLCTFMLVWSQLASFKDKEESKQINDKAWEMYNVMEGMEEKDWNDSVMNACQLHVKYRRNGKVGDEDFEKLFEYVLDFHEDNPSDGLNGRDLYYSYEYSYFTKEEYKQEFNFHGKRINDCWTDLEEYQSMVDCRLHELHEKYEDDDEKLGYAEYIRDLDEEDKDWRKRVKKDTRVVKAVEDHNKMKNNYPLKNGTEMHLENAVKLIALMRIWSRILGLPEKKPALSLGIKIMDMEMAMEFTDAHRDRAIAIADEAFENIHGGVEMMNFVEQEKIFLRLESYYQTFMNISGAAINNFIADYRENFVHCRAYETMIGILGQEIAQNFCCEDEKKAFADRVKELDDTDSAWRDRVSGDWRIKEAKDETGDPE